MWSFLSAVLGGWLFPIIYNIRKCFEIYFYFLREFAIFVGNFSNLGEFSRKHTPIPTKSLKFPLPETHFPQQGLAICLPPW